MKCLVLAGGKGNSLWPLSREKYPKQFMDVKPHRSLLQETIARNIPFCEEFLISTNSEYGFIVEGQMEKFQGLKYRCLLEQLPVGTCPAIAMACMICNPSEMLFVVSADQIIEGENYKDAIIAATEIAREGHLVTFGMEIEGVNTNYGYIRHEGTRVLEFTEKPDEETAKRYMESGDYYWNSGNFLFRAGDFLYELKKYAPDVYDHCARAIRRSDLSGQAIELTQEVLGNVPTISAEKAIFEKSEHVSVIKSDFNWFDIGSMDALNAYMKTAGSENVIEEKCQDVTVINHTPDKLVVANEMKDAVIVNTKDAIYISHKDHVEDVKHIMTKYHDRYSDYFEQPAVHYHRWGTEELLEDSATHEVRKVTVYPGETRDMRLHEVVSEIWTIVDGSALITLGNETDTYKTKSCIHVPAGVSHEIINDGEEPCVIIMISMGSRDAQEDTVKVAVTSAMKDRRVKSRMVRLEPAFKDNLWGGTKLKDIYGKKCDYDIVGESWELSAHKDGQSVVAEGRFKGMLFGEYLKLLGDEGLGWKCQAFERFPILIKFIDACQNLSIQVHPDDEYGLRVENEYGKNELWYIVDCEEGAFIYYGVNRPVSKEEFETRIRDNTILEVLNKVPVHKGDTFFVHAGMIHAIGAGVLICEIQQNSNSTYRLYDYDRRDKYGNPRELHINKAKDVCLLEPYVEKQEELHQPVSMNGCEMETLASCKYFVCNKYSVTSKAVVEVDDTSFCSIVFIEGEGSISVDGRSMSFKPADSFFVPAGKKKITVIGKCAFIQTHV